MTPTTPAMMVEKQTDRQRDVGPVHHVGEDVAAGVVGAEQVLERRRVASLSCRARDVDRVVRRDDRADDRIRIMAEKTARPTSAILWRRNRLSRQLPLVERFESDLDVGDRLRASRAGRVPICAPRDESNEVMSWGPQSYRMRGSATA